MNTISLERPGVQRRNHAGQNLPHIRAWQLAFFSRYVQRYLCRHFGGVHVLQRPPVNLLASWPILICMNHPSWWDPLLGLYLSQRFFNRRRHYTPIAMEGLKKYKFFEKLGFFGFDPGSLAGAAKFLRIGQGVLAQNDAVFWVTAEGKFRDVRERPTLVQRGVGHLAHGSTRLAMMPLALEYGFWNERTPEAFVCFGEPILIGDGRSRSAAEWLMSFRSALERTQETLRTAVVARKSENFERLLAGRTGVGGMYDLWRRFKAFLARTHFEPKHGDS